LFDTQLLTQHIESAYKTAYDRYHSELEVNHIHLDPQQRQSSCAGEKL